MTINNNLTKKLLIAIGIIVLILGLTAVLLFSPTKSKLNQKLTDSDEGIWENVDASTWMAHISGETKLSNISLPGSHDACSQYVQLPLMGRCQDSSITSQLEMGSRVLDIRLRTNEDGVMTISHGFLNCLSSASISADELTAESVFEECKAYLSDHPDETIIALVKHEYGDASDEEVEALMEEIINKDPSVWYTDNKDPMLDEVRGKIVLARRYGDNDSSKYLGLDFRWENQNGKEPVDNPIAKATNNNSVALFVQDRYEYSNNDKIAAINVTLKETPTNPDTYYLNYLSTKGTFTYGIPKQHAKTINSWFMDHEFCNNTNYGCLMFDFITEDLARHTFASNTYMP